MIRGQIGINIFKTSILLFTSMNAIKIKTIYIILSIRIEMTLKLGQTTIFLDITLSCTLPFYRFIYAVAVVLLSLVWQNDKCYVFYSCGAIR